MGMQEDEGLLGISNGVSAPAAAPVAAPATVVDEGSSLLSQYEQQEAFASDPTANGTVPGKHCVQHSKCERCCRCCNGGRGSS